MSKRIKVMLALLNTTVSPFFGFYLVSHLYFYVAWVLGGIGFQVFGIFVIALFVFSGIASWIVAKKDKASRFWLTSSFLSVGLLLILGMGNFVVIMVRFL